ncbi:MAG: hydrogenase 2 operon protein HybA [Rhodospirillales bacterium]|nr:hydrogenase 2 operon protein HybA [Rhodospirillales bacterium]
MRLNRRSFLTGLAAGGAAAGLGEAIGAAPARADGLDRAPKPRLPNAVGLLYDSTLCVGCKACVAGCKAANNMPPDISPDQRVWNEGTWDTPKGLSAKTLNVIRVYRDGDMEKKDREDNGFAFIKRQCLHCVDPSCVSCCPVSAMIKDPVTGIVRNDPSRCIGCRYCVFACPFEVPKFDLDSPFGRIHKCELCRHRLAEGKLPGCVEACPTGATLFGRVEDLHEEAKRRIDLAPGDTYVYPRGDISGKYGPSTPPHEKIVAAPYRKEIYGEAVLGGTQALYLSAVSFDKLGLPYGNVPDHAYASETEGVQHFIYQGMIAPAAVLTGLILVARRNFDQHHPPEEFKAAEAEAEAARLKAAAEADRKKAAGANRDGETGGRDG